MKQSFFLLLLLTFSISAFGQKMKFKKRQILFDKEVAYNFDKTAGKGLAELRAFAMVSAAGDTVLTFKPVELHFDALPFEEEAKYFNAYHEMQLHELTFVPTVISTKITDLIKTAAVKLVDLGYL